MTGQLLGGGGIVSAYARVQRSSAQSIPNNATTDITWQTEIEDTDTLWDVGTPTKFICVTAGVYLVTAGAQFAFNSTGGRGVTVEKNAATNVCAQRIGAITTNSNVTMVTCSGLIRLAVSDYLIARAYQDSGGSLNLNADDSTFFAIAKVRD